MSSLFAEHKNRLTELIARYRDLVDFLTIRLEQTEETNILLRASKIETLSESIALGGQVRACHHGGWGFSTFDDLDSLTARIEEAIAAAKMVGDSATILAAIDPVQTVCHLPLKGSDPRTISLGTKKALCDRYDELLRSYNDCLTTTTVSYGDSSQRVIIATSEGSVIEQSWCDLEMRFSATARQDDSLQTGRE
ncbi:MAG: DNA gyrase modulator, partial [Cyanobacteria bacterium P01_C01_bin.72]